MKIIEEQFENSDKALASILIKRLSYVRFHNTKGVCDYIMEMKNIAAQFKS